MASDSGPPVQHEAWDPGCFTLSSPSPALTPPVRAHCHPSGEERQGVLYFVLTVSFCVGIQLGVIFKEDRRSKVSGIIQTSSTLPVGGTFRKFIFNSPSQQGKVSCPNLPSPVTRKAGTSQLFLSCVIQSTDFIWVFIMGWHWGWGGGRVSEITDGHGPHLHQ